MKVTGQAAAWNDTIQGPPGLAFPRITLIKRPSGPLADGDVCRSKTFTAQPQQQTFPEASLEFKAPNPASTLSPASLGALDFKQHRVILEFKPLIQLCLISGVTWGFGLQTARALKPQLPTTQPQRVIPASRLTGNLHTYSNLRLAWNPALQSIINPRVTKVSAL